VPETQTLGSVGQEKRQLHFRAASVAWDAEISRRQHVVGIFPNEASIMFLTSVVLFEKNDEWQTSSSCMIVGAFAQIDKEEIDPLFSITTKAA
jgi:transposase-like protein